MEEMEVDLGVVSVVPKGEYSNTTSYEKLNIVEYNGGSYIAIQDTLGHLPTDSTYWECIVKPVEIYTSTLIGGYIGEQAYDNINNKPIWWNGTEWLYADGTSLPGGE